ncbi:MAG: TspO/MBR family protein [Rubripirellula sp.]
MNDVHPPKSVSIQAIGLATSILICFGAAGVGGLVTATGLESWYSELNKPSWNPPNWLFGPVWSLLYLMMAIAAWCVWRSSRWPEHRMALTLFAVQLALNSLWSLLFFGMRQPGWAAMEIVLLWIAILATLLAFWKHSKVASGLLVPYLFWVTFATVLNVTIWRLNV